MQVFGSLDVVKQVEAECRLKEKQPKVLSGNLVNGTCSGILSILSLQFLLRPPEAVELSLDSACVWTVMGAQQNASLVI